MSDHRLTESVFGAHKKQHLTKGVVLTKTRTIGFGRQPVQDDELAAGVSLPLPDERYSLHRDSTYIDARRGKR